MGFIPNQDVTATFDAKIIAVHATPVPPTILPYNPAIPIVGIEAVVTQGQRPLVVGGAPCTITLYGTDAAGNLYDIASVSYCSVPQIVAYTINSGPPQPGNLTPKQLAAFIAANILDLEYTQLDGGNKLTTMSFEEIAPAGAANTATGIQVSCGVFLNDGSGGWSFNDSVTTVPAGTVVPSPGPTYDVLLLIPSDPPNTTKLINVPGACLQAVTNG